MNKIPIVVKQLPRAATPQSLAPSTAATTITVDSRRAALPSQQATQTHAEQPNPSGWENWRQRTAQEIEVLRQQMHVAADMARSGVADQKPVERRLGGGEGGKAMGS